MADIYLIALRKPDSDVFDAIREEWPDAHHEVTDTQMLIAASNGGGKSEYERIRKRLGLDEDGRFPALIVGVNSTHGYHRKALWKWLADHGDV